MWAGKITLSATCKIEIFIRLFFYFSGPTLASFHFGIVERLSSASFEFWSRGARECEIRAQKTEDAGKTRGDSSSWEKALPRPRDKSIDYQSAVDAWRSTWNCVVRYSIQSNWAREEESWLPLKVLKEGSMMLRLSNYIWASLEESVYFEEWSWR